MRNPLKSKPTQITEISLGLRVLAYDAFAFGALVVSALASYFQDLPFGPGVGPMFMMHVIWLGLIGAVPPVFIFTLSRKFRLLPDGFEVLTGRRLVHSVKWADITDVRFGLSSLTEAVIWNVKHGGEIVEIPISRRTAPLTDALLRNAPRWTLPAYTDPDTLPKATPFSNSFAMQDLEAIGGLIWRGIVWTVYVLVIYFGWLIREPGHENWLIGLLALAFLETMRVSHPAIRYHRTNQLDLEPESIRQHYRSETTEIRWDDVRAVVHAAGVGTLVSDHKKYLFVPQSGVTQTVLDHTASKMPEGTALLVKSSQLPRASS